MMMSDELVPNGVMGLPDFLLDDSYMGEMLCAEEAELMRALGGPGAGVFEGGGEFSGSGSDDSLDGQLNDKSVVVAAQQAAGLQRGGMRRAALSMNDLTALDPLGSSGKASRANGKAANGKKAGKGGLVRKNSKRQIAKLETLDELSPMPGENMPRVNSSQGLSQQAMMKGGYGMPMHNMPAPNVYQDPDQRQQMMQQQHWEQQFPDMLAPVQVPGGPSPEDGIQSGFIPADMGPSHPSMQMPLYNTPQYKNHVNSLHSGLHGVKQGRGYPGQHAHQASGSGRPVSKMRRVASSPSIAQGPKHLAHGAMNGFGDGDKNGAAADDGQIRIGTLTLEERRARILRYRQKRHERNFRKRIKYNCRKTLADSRPRIRGRFARNDEIEELLRQKKLSSGSAGSAEASGASGSGGPSPSSSGAKEEEPQSAGKQVANGGEIKSENKEGASSAATGQPAALVAEP